MLMQDERLNAGRRQEIAGGIRAETQRLLGMVGQLIEVARLDAGKDIRLNLAPVALSEVVRYATDTVRAQLTDKDLRLVVLLAEALPRPGRRGENDLGAHQSAIQCHSLLAARGGAHHPGGALGRDGAAERGG
ncbi:MAG: hypothetical protein WKG07_15065 [Hymenobacter sp.]